MCIVVAVFLSCCGTVVALWLYRVVCHITIHISITSLMFINVACEVINNYTAQTHVHWVMSCYLKVFTMFKIRVLFLMKNKFLKIFVLRGLFFFSTSDRASKEVRNTREPDLCVAWFRSSPTTTSAVVGSNASVVAEVRARENGRYDRCSRQMWVTKCNPFSASRRT